MVAKTFNTVFFADNYPQLLSDSQWFQHLHPDPWYKVKNTIPALKSWHTVTLKTPPAAKSHSEDLGTVNTLLSAVNHCVRLYGEPGWHTGQWHQHENYQWLMGLNMQSWLWSQDYLYTLWQCELTATEIKLTHS
jgi:hypothetical protein